MVLVHLFLFFITRKAAFLVTLRDRLYRAAFIDPHRNIVGQINIIFALLSRDALLRDKRCTV